MNRTPAAKAIKFGGRLVHRDEVIERRRIAREKPGSVHAVEVAAMLRQSGYSEANSLISDADLEELAQAMAGAGVEGGDQNSPFNTQKDFWVPVLERHMIGGQLPASSPLARFAMQPELISALARIFGEIPRLSYVAVTLSRPTQAELQVSQLWHRDFDDTKVVKLFVYLTDVSEDDGPFTFLPGPPSDRVGFTLRSHQPDTQFSKRADLRDVVAMTGPRLSCFLVETSRCWHMGSRVNPGHSRLMYTATYVSSPSIYPKRSLPFFSLTGAEDALERRLLSA